MKSRKAIIIDDDPVALSLLKQILQRRGYEVQEHEEPVKALMYQDGGCPCPIHGRCPDLIVSDYNMPVLNGVELLESFITKGCRCRHFALISGKGLMENDLIRMAKHETRFFTKPLDLADFYDWLDRVEQEIDYYMSLDGLGITTRRPPL